MRTNKKRLRVHNGDKAKYCSHQTKQKRKHSRVKHVGDKPSLQSHAEERHSELQVFSIFQLQGTASPGQL